MLFHNFWVYNPADPQRTLQMANFMKNFGIVGGQLMVVVFGPGRWSFDAARAKHPTP
ncbi:MAG: hypothetical protein LLG00_15485 [Planctomycetaceae bacterium]|nr:hypothetical protein [Planctomycetaceae bacterium]